MTLNVPPSNSVVKENLSFNKFTFFAFQGVFITSNVCFSFSEPLILENWSFVKFKLNFVSIQEIECREWKNYLFNSTE